MNALLLCQPHLVLVSLSLLWSVTGFGSFFVLHDLDSLFFMTLTVWSAGQASCRMPPSLALSDVCLLIRLGSVSFWRDTAKVEWPCPYHVTGHVHHHHLVKWFLSGTFTVNLLDFPFLCYEFFFLKNK